MADKTTKLTHLHQDIAQFQHAIPNDMPQTIERQKRDKPSRSFYGFSIILPVVLRASRSACAVAASLKAYTAGFSS